MGNKNIKCSEGDIVLLPSNTLHQVDAETENADVVAIVYKEEFLKIPAQWAVRQSGGRVFGKKCNCYEKLNLIFSEAVELFGKGEVTYELEMTACLLKLTSIFVKEGMASSEKYNSAEQRILPVLEYIRENVDKPIKISDLTEIIYVSKEHLIRLFKSATGKTPMEYITDSKIQKAMVMIEENIYPISAISEKLSFANPSHFSKVFRQKLNKSPSQYKKEQLK